MLGSPKLGNPDTLHELFKLLIMQPQHLIVQIIIFQIGLKLVSLYFLSCLFNHTEILHLSRLCTVLIEANFSSDYTSLS